MALQMILSTGTVHHGANRRNQKPRSRGVDLTWWVWLIAFSALMFLQLSQTASALVFTLAVVIYALGRPDRAIAAVFDSSLLWPFLLLAIVSAFWSENPDWTFRAALELILTALAAVLMALALSPKSFISAVMCSCLIATIASVIYVGGDLPGQLVSGYPINGIFLGSKNSFGGAEAILILAGFWMVLDRSRPPIVRLLTAACLPASGILLIGSRSAAALVALICALILSYAVFLLRKFSGRGRTLALIALFFVSAAIGTILALFANELFSEFLGVTGKDVSLSDRTILWDWASRVIIPAHPVLGTGFDAFWSDQNPYAQELVRIFGIGNKLHFHNEWYEMTVELGFVGLAISAVTFILIVIEITRWAFRAPSPESCFYLGFVIYTAVRTYVEVDLFKQFASGFVLFIVGYIYARNHRKRQIVGAGAVPISYALSKHWRGFRSRSGTVLSRRLIKIVE